MKNKNSITGAYLSGKIKIPVPEERRKPSGWLKVVGARENNLKNIDVDFPLGVMTCVTGVSGSGKSSLVNEILYKKLAHDLNHARTIPGKHKKISGLDQVDSYATCLLRLQTQRREDIRRGGSASMSRADAAKPVRGMEF